MTAEPSFWSSAFHLAGRNVGFLPDIMNAIGIFCGIASTELLPWLLQRFGRLPPLAAGGAMPVFCATLRMALREPRGSI